MVVTSDYLENDKEKDLNFFMDNSSYFEISTFNGLLQKILFIAKNIWQIVKKSRKIEQIINIFQAFKVFPSWLRT